MSTAWRDSAACAQVPIVAGADPWYPRDSGGGSYADARKVCGLCPVREACLADALATETATTRHGMWGGLTPDERAARTPKPVRIKAPAAETRARVVRLNAAGEGITQIAEALHLTEATVRAHLRTAKAEGLLDGKAPPTVDARCGTPAGRTAHYRRGEAGCAACKRAETRYRAERAATGGVR